MSSIGEDFIKTLQVMVVDDDATFRHYLEVQLEMLGCQIVPMENGETAWERIQLQPPDLVLTDVFMPGMSGLELCRRIKSTPELQTVPVVLLTMAGPKAKDDGYKAGADDFLNKPPHLMELKARLHNLLMLRSLQIVSRPEAAEEHSRESLTRKSRVLMVESYGILREHVREFLSQEGWEFQGADTVDRFLEILEAERPDLVIIDQDLMEGSGSALVARLRNQAATANLPVLLMCDPGALEAGGAAWSAGADEHLVKPFEAPELRARVKALLKHAQLRNRKDGQHPDADASALKDPRTGAFTRPFLIASLEALCGFAALAGRSVGLMAFQLSETQRASLPEVRNIAGLLRAQLLPHEFLCRAEENLFVAVMPDVDALGIERRLWMAVPTGNNGRISTWNCGGSMPCPRCRTLPVMHRGSTKPLALCWRRF